MSEPQHIFDNNEPDGFYFLFSDGSYWVRQTIADFNRDYGDWVVSNAEDNIKTPSVILWSCNRNVQLLSFLWREIDLLHREEARKYRAKYQVSDGVRKVIDNPEQLLDAMNGVTR